MLVISWPPYFGLSILLLSWPPYFGLFGLLSWPPYFGLLVEMKLYRVFPIEISTFLLVASVFWPPRLLNVFFL